MYKYILKGKIHPERVLFTLKSEIPIQTEHVGFGINGLINLKIVDSIITASFESDVLYSNSNTSELETLRNILEENVRAIVDIYCYVKSYGYDLEIEMIECPELNLYYQFGVRGEWNIDKNDRVTNEEFSKLISLFTTPENGALSAVFADFRRAIKYPSMTASFCFRAIESIRQGAFENKTEANEKKRREDGWDRLRNELGFGRTDFEEIERFAKPNRHGVYPQISYQERERVMNFTRSIIDRTIDWIYAKQPPVLS